MSILFTNVLLADVNKGKRYYMKNFKQKFKLNGLEFVHLHTQQEWEVLFENQAEGFIKEFSKRYPKHEKYLQSEKTKKRLYHVKDFAIMYAKDSGNTPSCGEEDSITQEQNFKLEGSSGEDVFKL